VTQATVSTCYRHSL